MTHACECEPVGVVDIADRLGLKQNTVSQIQLRGRMPDAQGKVSNVPWWCWPHTIEPWAIETGRLVEA